MPIGENKAQKSLVTVLVALALLILIGFLLMGGVNAMLSAKREETIAKGLLKRPFSEVRKAFGSHGRAFSEDVFNELEQPNLSASYSPRPIPLAAGDVYVVHRFPTVIILYSHSGIVGYVYIGRT